MRTELSERMCADFPSKLHSFKNFRNFLNDKHRLNFKNGYSLPIFSLSSKCRVKF